MDAEAESVKSENAALKAEKKELEATLGALKAAPSVVTLRASMECVKGEIAELAFRINRLRAGTVQPVSAEEKDVVDGEYDKMERALRQRNKMFKDLWEVVIDGQENVSAKELWVSPPRKLVLTSA